MKCYEFRDGLPRACPNIALRTKNAGRRTKVIAARRHRAAKKTRRVQCSRVSQFGRGCVKTHRADAPSNIDLSERSVFDYFSLRKGKRTPETETALRFYTASTISGLPESRAAFPHRRPYGSLRPTTRICSNPAPVRQLVLQ